MGERRTSIFENGLIWFGAAVSIAEILTGTYFASLPFWESLAAIVLGHVIGCAMLFLAGLIGGTVRESAMETVKRSFGAKGGALFSILNIVQLVGWTAIMIYDGALAAEGVWSLGKWVWCLVIGGLIVLWIFTGIERLGRLNTAAMAALLLLTVLLCFVIFGGGGAPMAAVSGEAMGFGAAVELSVAMPLSWLPLISDYTREAREPKKASAASALVYGAASCFMYIIGMGAARFTGESDIAQILLKAGLGAAGLLIVVFSTVTTTFLDAYSAGVSSESLFPSWKGTWAAAAAAAVGTLGAIFLPLSDITDFLYFIGSVFAPMIAVQIADFFLLKRNCRQQALSVRNLIIWAIGFAAYRFLMGVELPVGSTLPDMLLTAALCLAAGRLFPSPAPSSEQAN